MAGIGGAYMSLIYTPHWAEEITAGRGWIALALGKPNSISSLVKPALQSPAKKIPV